MNQLSRKNDARADADRRGSRARGKDLFAGVLLLLGMQGAAGCAIDPTIDEEELVNSVSEEARWTGLNGIPPEVLLGNYLSRKSTDLAGVTTFGQPQALTLCQSFIGVSCDLRMQWGKWLNPTSVFPPDKDTLNRLELLKALVQFSMTSDVVVHIPGFGDVNGMFGLVPLWTTSPLSPAEQRLLSAAILVKVNNFQASVPIGVVGPGPGTEAPLPIEDKLYTHQQAVFYADLFTNSPRRLACTGHGGDPAVGENERICHKPGNLCNIMGLGSCATWCTGGWAGIGIPTGEYCISAKDTTGAVYDSPLTVYLKIIQ